MTVLLWLPIGITAGILNGLTLRWTVDRLRPDAVLIGAPLIAMGFVLRLGLSAGLLATALQRGIVPGLLACAGLWLARWLVVYVALSPRLLFGRPKR